MNEMMRPAGRSVVVFGVLLEGALGLGAWLLGWLLGQPAGATLHADFPALALGLAAAGPLMLVFFWLEHSPLESLARIRRFLDDVVRPLFEHCSVFDLALIAVAAGVGEELLFRGVIQAWAGQRLGVVAGMVVANLLFGLLHPITPAYVVLASLMGAYLGTVWLASGNLLVPIAAHALYDFLALAYLMRGRVSPNATDLSGDHPAQEGDARN